MKTVKMTHELCFEERGKTSAIIMELSEDANKQEVAKEMAAAMEKMQIEEKKTRY